MIALSAGELARQSDSRHFEQGRFRKLARKVGVPLHAADHHATPSPSKALRSMNVSMPSGVRRWKQHPGSQRWTLRRRWLREMPYCASIVGLTLGGCAAVVAIDGKTRRWQPCDFQQSTAARVMVAIFAMPWLLTPMAAMRARQARAMRSPGSVASWRETSPRTSGMREQIGAAADARGACGEAACFQDTGVLVGYSLGRLRDLPNFPWLSDRCVSSGSNAT